MINTEIASSRLQNQMLVHSPFRKVEDVVGWMLAVQAQDFFASLLAIGLRISPSVDMMEKMVEQVIDDRKIVRTWPMRGTIHLLASEDVRWMLRLLTPRVIQSSAGRYRELELDEAVFLQSRKLLENALQGGKQLTRKELYGILEDHGISTAGQRGIHIMGHLAQNEVICFGTRRDKQHTFTLLEEWVPKSRELTGDEALSELTARYYRSHGPATANDFASWSGMKVSDTRRGIEMVKSGLEYLKVEEKTYWFAGQARKPVSVAKPKEVWLLPAFDEMLCGYKDKSAILKSEHIKSAILKNGMVCPMILVDGRVIGTWRRELKKGNMVFKPEYFEKPTKFVEKVIQKKAVQIGNFLGKTTVFS